MCPHISGRVLYVLYSSLWIRRYTPHMYLSNVTTLTHQYRFNKWQRELHGHPQRHTWIFTATSTHLIHHPEGQLLTCNKNNNNTLPVTVWVCGALLWLEWKLITLGLLVLSHWARGPIALFPSVVPSIPSYLFCFLVPSEGGSQGTARQHNEQEETLSQVSPICGCRQAGLGGHCEGFLQGNSLL